VDGSTFRPLDFSPQIPAIPRNVARVPMSGNPLIEQSPNNDNRTNFRAATSVSSVCSVVQFPFVGGPAFRDTKARWTRSDRLGPARTRSSLFPPPAPGSVPPQRPLRTLRLVRLLRPRREGARSRKIRINFSARLKSTPARDKPWNPSMNQQIQLAIGDSRLFAVCLRTRPFLFRSRKCRRSNQTTSE